MTKRVKHDIARESRKRKSYALLSTACGMVAAAAAIGELIASRRHAPYSFRGRTVLITGGSRGLGLALAQQLARERAHLVLVARDQAELERAAGMLPSTAASVQTIACDVRDEAAVRHAVESAAGPSGRLDMIVNNAGVLQAMPFEHAQTTDFEDSLATHFWAPLHAIRAAVPIMRRQGQGRIVNIASVGGRIGVPHLAPYCAGKFALVGLSETLHAELRKDGIVVTTVTPGLMRTGSHRNVTVRGQHTREARWFGLASATPLTSMAADRAARQILTAVREGRARCTPGRQARAAELASSLTPELFAAVMGGVAAVLPRPAAGGDAGRRSSSLDLGWLVETLLPTGAAERFNQPPVDHAANNGRWSPGPSTA